VSFTPENRARYVFNQLYDGYPAFWQTLDGRMGCNPRLSQHMAVIGLTKIPHDFVSTDLRQKELTTTDVRGKKRKKGKRVAN